MALSLPHIVQKARTQLAALTGLGVGSTVSSRKDDTGWVVRVEVVEKRSLPDSQDILAMYEVTLDEAGGMLNFARIGMRRRTDVAAVAGAEAGA